MQINTADYAFGHLSLGSDDYAEIMSWLEDFVPGEFDIVKHKKKRSVTANAYLWHLCEEIAKATGETKIHVYQQEIKQVGVFEQLLMEPKAIPEFSDAVSQFGIGYFIEIVDADPKTGMILVNYYKGSSSYDTAQFSRLLDNVIQDARAVGVETLTDRELSLIKDGYAKERGEQK